MTLLPVLIFWVQILLFLIAPLLWLAQLVMLPHETFNPDEDQHNNFKDPKKHFCNCLLKDDRGDMSDEGDEDDKGDRGDEGDEVNRADSADWVDEFDGAEGGVKRRKRRRRRKCHQSMRDDKQTKVKIDLLTT